MKKFTLPTFLFLLAIFPYNLQAEIIYTDIKDVLITTGNSQDFDINGDGIKDFKITVKKEGSYTNQLIAPLNGAFIAQNFGIYAQHFSNTIIQKDRRFANKEMYLRRNGLYGNWAGYSNKRPGGIRIYINGKAHLGWIGLKRSNNSMAIVDFAYETCPEEPIIGGAKIGGEACVLVFPIPTLSEWGLLILALLLMTLGTLYLLQPRVDEKYNGLE